MKFFDVYDNDNVESEELFALDSRTVTANGTGVDISDYEGNLAIFVHADDMTAGTLIITIETSADDSTYTAATAIDGSTAFTTITTANGGLRGLRFNTESLSKYVRAVATIAGGGTASFGVFAFGRKDRTDNA